MPFPQKKKKKMGLRNEASCPASQNYFVTKQEIKFKSDSQTNFFFFHNSPLPSKGVMLAGKIWLVNILFCLDK